jgi:thiamine-monophosphate kinase
MSGESSIIARLSRIIPSCIGWAPSRRVSVGIGDDAAVVVPSRGRNWIVSTDAFIEGRHFLTRLHRPHAVGYKALARAVSDLAAMGAEPRYFLLTLALPTRRAGAWLDEFARGMGEGAGTFQMHLIGGDVSRDNHVAAVVTVIGESPRRRVLTRCGARPGDALYVSGWLGVAEAGLQLLLHGGPRAIARNSLSYSLQRHLYPQPRLALGAWLAARGLASAAMDLSDGLSTDLARLCAASRIGAVVHAATLPSAVARHRGTRRGELLHESAAQLRRALHGGDDYELLFTVPQRRVSYLPSHFRGVPITRIGEITFRRSVLLETNGRKRALRSLGWEHFASR